MKQNKSANNVDITDYFFSVTAAAATSHYRCVLTSILSDVYIIPNFVMMVDFGHCTGASVIFY